jgi:hypothetical protein
MAKQKNNQHFVDDEEGEQMKRSIACTIKTMAGMLHFFSDPIYCVDHLGNSFFPEQLQRLLGELVISQSCACCVIHERALEIVDR